MARLRAERQARMTAMEKLEETETSMIDGRRGLQSLMQLETNIIASLPQGSSPGPPSPTPPYFFRVRPCTHDHTSPLTLHPAPRLTPASRWDKFIEEEKDEERRKDERLSEKRAGRRYLFPIVGYEPAAFAQS